MFLISHNSMVLIQPFLGVGVESGGNSWVGHSSSFLLHATKNQMKNKLGFSLHEDTVLKGEKNSMCCVSPQVLCLKIFGLNLWGVDVVFLFNLLLCFFFSFEGSLKYT